MKICIGVYADNVVATSLMNYMSVEPKCYKTVIHCRASSGSDTLTGFGVSASNILVLVQDGQLIQQNYN
jgi:hypothetical protein